MLADTLAAVEHAGVLHGDIKPGNMVVEDLSQARVSLVDFGLADGSAGDTLQYAPPDRLAGAGLLTRLEPAELRQLASDLLGQAGDLDALVTSLHSASGGCPLRLST